MVDERRFLTVAAVAEMLGLHSETVRRMVRERRIPAFKAGRSWRFDAGEIDSWRRRQRRALGGRARVMVVDDSAHVRDVIRLTLEEAGYVVVLAETGDGAIASLGQVLPDLVLLDLKMPGGSGVDVIREIRVRSEDVPVIIVTGYPDSDLMHRAMEYGPFLVLAKPVAPDKLLAAVERALITHDTPPKSMPRSQSRSLYSMVIVDDDEKVCQSLQRIAAQLGVEARYATGGRAGLELIEQSPPDVVALDLRMPEMNGPRFLEELRKIQPDLPVIIVTGFPDSDLMQEAMRHPPVLLLPKPVGREALDRTMKSVLQHREPREPELAPRPASTGERIAR